MKFLIRIFIIAFVVAAFMPMSACRLIYHDDSLLGQFSRRDAIGIYAGGIAESEFLERLGEKPRVVPGMVNTFELDLKDGELFYKVEMRDSIRWVSDIVLPAAEDVPDELRNYAGSFNKIAAKNNPSSTESYRGNEIIYFTLNGRGELFSGNGQMISLDSVRDEFSKIGKLDFQHQPSVVLKVDSAVDIGALARLISMSENLRVKKLSISDSKKNACATPRKN